MLELVLRQAGTTGSGQRLPVNPGQDIRLFLPQPAQTKTLTLSVTVPTSLSTGTYDLFLNLPDNATSLKNIKEYSIRLANVGTWDSGSGYKKLGTIIIK